MPSRSAEQALDALLISLRAVAACVTAQPLFATHAHYTTRPYVIAFIPTGRAVVLRVNDDRRVFGCNLTLTYDIAGDRSSGYDVRIAGYAYDVLDAGGREIIAYHRHPSGVSHVRRPHLHLSSTLQPIDIGRQQDPLRLANLHLRTGALTLVDFVELLIQELDVRPRTARWERVLEEHRARLEHALHV